MKFVKKIKNNYNKHKEKNKNQWESGLVIPFNLSKTQKKVNFNSLTFNKNSRLSKKLMNYSKKSRIYCMSYKIK
jgi:hypothetical protein